MSPLDIQMNGLYILHVFVSLVPFLKKIEKILNHESSLICPKRPPRFGQISEWMVDSNFSNLLGTLLTNFSFVHRETSKNLLPYKPLYLVNRVKKYVKKFVRKFKLFLL